MTGGGEVGGAGLALKYRLTSCTVQFTNTLTFLLRIYTTVSALAAVLCPVSFHTDVTMYEPRSPPPPPPPLPPPSPPFGSRFLVTGVGMSEGRVGVVDDDVVVVGVAVTSALLFLGLGV